MKRLIGLVILLFTLAMPVLAEQPQLTRQFTFTSAVASDTIGVFGTGISLHRVQWQLVNGTASACTFTLDGSDDNSTWTSIVSAQTCTSSGSSSFVLGSYGFLRINVSALTLTTARGITIAWTGFVPAPNLITTYDSGTTPLQIAGSTFTHMAVSTSTGALWSVKGVAGLMHSISIETKAAEANSTLKCFNNLSATGTPVINIDIDATSTTYVYDTYFSTAITCALAGSPNISIAYR